MEKTFFKNLLTSQKSTEEKKHLIDLMRSVWEYYDDNYCFPAFGIDDGGRVDFLIDVFLHPLIVATDEVAKDIGYESSEKRMMRRICEAAVSSPVPANGVIDDAPPF